MKGILLAAGTGTRLRPISKLMTKQLLPVYNKPMIYYPLSTLMLANIRDIFIICTERDKPLYQRLLGDGHQIGLNIEYGVQDKPNGIAEAFLIAENFVGNDSVCLMLGDNIIYGRGLPEILKRGVDTVNSSDSEISVIYGHHVDDPKRYGVVEYDDDYNVISLEEKPENPKSDCASIGLYMYDNSVIRKAKKLEPSNRGELEITDINKLYLQNNNLALEVLGRGYAWFDAGTHDSLLESANFIQTVEKRQGLKIACIEEIAYYMNYIDRSNLLQLANNIGKNQYAQYLFKIASRTSK
tara:strand:- start:1619 stop:2509 length:891 start_codon:yes stop_codon:yes gene_type:complete